MSLTKDIPTPPKMNINKQEKEKKKKEKNTGQRRGGRMSTKTQGGQVLTGLCSRADLYLKNIGCQNLSLSTCNFNIRLLCIFI